MRLQSLRLLVERGRLDDEVADRLTGDSDALVRSEAFATLSDRGRSFSEEEVRRILVPPQRQAGGILFGSLFSTGADKQGEELFEKYRIESLIRLPKAELRNRVETGLVFDDAAYFALMERHFANQTQYLQHDVDDTYKSYFEQRIRRADEITRRLEGLGEMSINKDLAKDAKELQDSIRRKLSRKGLDILCRKGMREDAKRIRANLKSGYAEASKLDAAYLENHGEWSDVALLVAADSPKGGLMSLSGNQAYREAVARTAYKIGRHSVSKLVSELISFKTPAAILQTGSP